MDIALCTCDKKSYTAAEFGKNPDLRRRCHGHLKCVGRLTDGTSVCGAGAYYRPGASNGPKAHFGARKHVEGCDRAAHHAVGRPTPLEEEVQRILTDNRRLRIDLGSAPTGQPGPAVDPPANPEEAHPVRRAHTGEPPRVRVPEVSLARFLEYLVNTDFATSDMLLRIEHEERPVHAWVAELGTAGARVGQRHLFWGRVAQVAQERGWLDVAGPDPAHVRVAGPLAGTIWIQLTTPATRAVAPGTPVIVLGTVVRRRQTYVAVTSPHQIAHV